MTPTGNWRIRSSAFIGTARPSLRWNVRWAISSPAGGASMPDQLAGSVRQSRQRLIVTGRCLPQSARITLENLDDKNMTYITRSLHADRSAARCRLSARPVPATVRCNRKGPTRSWMTFGAPANTSALTWRGKFTVRVGGAKGEIKFFLDGDKEFPTICGTGTEDYFCGSYTSRIMTRKNTRFYHALYRPGASPAAG